MSAQAPPPPPSLRRSLGWALALYAVGVASLGALTLALRLLFTLG